MGQLLACMVDAEAPRDADSGAIAPRHPGRDLLHQDRLGRNAAIQTLARQDRPFEFGDVEPGAMGGGEVPLEALQDAARLVRWEGLVERGGAVGGRIVCAAFCGRGERSVGGCQWVGDATEWESTTFTGHQLCVTLSSVF